MTITNAPPAHAAREPFAERNGGWILAVCLHVMLFALLFLIQREQARPAANRRPIVFRFEPAAAPEAEPQRVLSFATEYDRAGDPESQEQEDGAAEEVFGNPEAEVTGMPGAGTGAGGEKNFEQPAAMTPEAAVESEAPQSILFETEPATDAQADAVNTAGLSDEQNEVIEQLRRRAAEMDAANRAQGTRGSSDVEQLLRLAQTDQAEIKTLQRTPRMREGVDREIDIKDVSLETAQEVLAKYGIKIMIMDLTKGPMPKFKDGYINRAVTNSGVMVRPQRLAREKYLAFTYGTIAEKQMAHLEESALKTRGFDPENCQVQRIIFGIVPTTDGFDLGVTYIDAKPMADAAKKPAAVKP